jgi:hypothetical protein
MNTFLDEQTAEYNRQRILDDVKQIRLERLALSSQTYRPGIFERTMFRFANWMIATGKHLRKRYEIPQVNCNHTPAGSPAQ